MPAMLEHKRTWAAMVKRGRRVPLGTKASLMSSTKWHKLFVALETRSIAVPQAIVKFVDDAAEYRIATPGSRNFRVPHGYVDLPETGPLSLRLIEWIEFPRIARSERCSPNGTGRIPDVETEQDIDGLHRALQQIGRFAILWTDRGLRIEAYAR
jgi:hypothetical protein